MTSRLFALPSAPVVSIKSGHFRHGSEGSDDSDEFSKLANNNTEPNGWASRQAAITIVTPTNRSGALDRGYQ